MLCTQLAMPELGDTSEGPVPLEPSLPEVQKVDAAALSLQQAGPAVPLSGPSKGNSAGSGSQAKAGAAAGQRGRKQAVAQQLSAGCAGATPAAGAGAGAAPPEAPHRAALQQTKALVPAAGATQRTSGDLLDAAPCKQVLSDPAPAAAGARKAPAASALGELAWRSVPDQNNKMHKHCLSAAILCFVASAPHLHAGAAASISGCQQHP